MRLGDLPVACFLPTQVPHLSETYGLAARLDALEAVANSVAKEVDTEPDVETGSVVRSSRRSPRVPIEGLGSCEKGEYAERGAEHSQPTRSAMLPLLLLSDAGQAAELAEEVEA